MSYTDKTVYKMRDCIDGYTDIALSYRSEKEREEYLQALLRSNNIDVPEVDSKQESYADIPIPGTADKIMQKMVECIMEYDRIKNQLEAVRIYNRTLESILHSHKIPYVRKRSFL